MVYTVRWIATCQPLWYNKEMRWIFSFTLRLQWCQTNDKLFDTSQIVSQSSDIAPYTLHSLLIHCMHLFSHFSSQINPTYSLFIFIFERTLHFIASLQQIQWRKFFSWPRTKGRTLIKAFRFYELRTPIILVTNTKQLNDAIVLVYRVSVGWVVDS